jgi:biotin transport system substrate-specific component
MSIYTTPPRSSGAESQTRAFVPGAAVGGSRPAVRGWPLKVAMGALFVGLLAASAWVSVPFFPVPLTMQTLAVLMAGATLGPIAGASTVFSYLILGLMGAPVFHNGLGGPAILFGPTGGYLLAFVASAYLMGLAVSRTRRAGILATWRGLVWLAAGAMAASAVVYAVGVPWLSLFPGMGLERAVAVGMIPFLLGDTLKAAVAIGAVRAGASLRGRMGESLF